jgi:kynurenine formamidase
MIKGMMITIELLNETYLLNTVKPLSLAIPVEFQTEENITTQPNHFSAHFAASKPMQAGPFIGDTELGGSCNVNELTINPHCNGTHTETIAHICDFNHELSTKITDISPAAFMPCVLVSIKPKQLSDTTETYTPALVAGDQIITRTALESLIANYNNEQLQCLTIRTLPNNEDKCRQIYAQNNQPPFFSREAILYLNERGVEHLVLDTPSLDRLHDDGLLTCHHLFWQVEEGSHQANNESLVNKTITEMAFIDNQTSDGFYFINLQIPAFINDAAPSNPVLYDCKKITQSFENKRENL